MGMFLCVGTIPTVLWNRSALYFTRISRMKNLTTTDIFKNLNKQIKVHDVVSKYIFILYANVKIKVVKVTQFQEDLCGLE